MTNAKFSFTYNKQLIAKLSEHFSELQRDEESAWQKISLALANFEDVEQQRWQDLRKYFKCSLVFQLSRQRFTDDQELIDRLQYPYLRKVYSVTISFVDKALRQERENRKDNVEDNTLFIKSVINGTYDPAVVAAYKRLGKKGTRIYVYINVNDPRYNLTADQRELLMQIERSRKRKKKTGRQLEAGTWHDVAVNVSPEPTTNGSTRKLLDEESLNINTQEYNQIIKDSLEPEISSSPKKRRFTVDSEVDSEDHEGIDISSASETSVVDLTSAEGDRPTDAEIIFVDPNNVLNANISINASRDPLQMSVRLTPCCEVPASGRIADGENDNTTSEPLFTPSSGESVKTTTDQTTEPVQSAPEMPQAPIAKNSEPKILRSSVRKRMGRLNRVPENMRSVLAKLIVSNCISDSGDSDSDLSDASDVKEVPPNDEAISDNPQSMAKAAEDDSPTSPVVAHSSTRADGSGSEARSTSSSDAVHVALPSVQPATFSSTINSESIPTKSADKTAAAEPKKTDQPQAKQLHDNVLEGTSSAVDVSQAVQQEQKSTLVANRPPADKSLVDNLNSGPLAFAARSTNMNSSIKNAGSVSDLTIQIQAPASSDVAQMTKTSGEPVQPQQVNSRVEPNPVLRNASPSESQASISDRHVDGVSDRNHFQTSRDPLQMSARPTPCREVPASGRIADGEKDSSTSEPLFTPSSGESVKTTTDQATEPVQTAPEMPQAPIEKTRSSTCSEPKILRSSVRKRMRRLNRVPENLRSVLAKLIVSNCISDSDDSGDSDSDLSDALDVKKEPPDDEAISDNPRSMTKAAEDDSPTSPVVAGEARPASGNRPSADKSFADNLSSVLLASAAQSTDANSCIENADKSVSDPVIQIQAKPSDESVQPQQVNSRAPAKPSSIVEANPVVRIASPSESQASIPDRLFEGSLCGEENSVADESLQTVEKMTDVSKATVPHQDRWAVHHRILNPILRNHLALYGTLRQRCPQLFQRTANGVFSDLNSLNGAITATLFAALTPTDIVRIIQVRAMVDTLAIRIAYGLTPQELERAQQVAKPNRPVLAKRNWEIVVASESVEDLVPAPKRLKISESGSSSFTLQSNSPVVICLSDSEDAPSLRLPVRKSRQYRVRQLR